MGDEKPAMVFSAKSLLVVSIAVNIWFIAKMVLEGKYWGTPNPKGFCSEEKQRNGTMAGGCFGCEAHVSTRTLLGTSDGSPPPPPSPSPPPFSTSRSEVQLGSDTVINLDHGDPTMYESFWRQMGDKTTITISGWQSISYFSDFKSLCWFLEPEFANAVLRLHKLVGNAVTDDRQIVVGAGSTQLFQALLYALSPPNASEPMNVVSAAPFYSSYPSETDYLKSGLYKWAGDAHIFNEDRPFIELVTSPNNPDGSLREAVVKREKGILVHDFAYYWPQYTPITSPANHDIMLFTVSKSTGHAGIRIGWALVKDKEIAKRMTKFIELNSIGVSKDSQQRAAKILEALSDSYDYPTDFKGLTTQPFFDFGHDHMAKRWKQFREAVAITKRFSLPEFPRGTCTFSGRSFQTQPAFAWIKCEGGEIEDCESFLMEHKIMSRGGKHFGSSGKYARISMLARDEVFDLFIKRLSKM